jgi:hypothetical protein
LLVLELLLLLQPCPYRCTFNSNNIHRCKNYIWQGIAHLTAYQKKEFATVAWPWGELIADYLMLPARMKFGQGLIEPPR